MAICLYFFQQINIQKAKPQIAKTRITKTKAFSLIELLVVLSIITLLLTLGSQSYVRHIQKSKLLQAQSDLLMLASRLEQYKLFNLNYLGAAGTQTSPENTGKPWVFKSYSPAHKPEHERFFDLSISHVSNSGSEYQITATPIAENSASDYSVLIYYSDGRRGYDKNQDGFFTDDEMCWDCL